MSKLIEIKITPDEYVQDVVTIQEAKDYCRVDFCDDDNLFSQLIESSRQYLEQYTCRVFLPSTCKAVYTQEGCGDRILLSYSDNIVLPDDSKYKHVLTGESYIDTCDKVVLLEYSAGYSIDGMPQWIKQAVLMNVAWRYENRGDVSAKDGINNEVEEFLKPYVNWSFL